MMVKHGDPHLLFSIENRTVTAGQRIETGVYPLKADFNLTILFDMTLSANPTQSGAVASVWKLIRVYNDGISGEGIKIGKRSASNQNAQIWWMTTASTGAGVSNIRIDGAYRNRIAVTHEAGSDTLKVSWRKGTETRRDYTVTNTFVASSTNQLYFGQGTNGTSSLPPGTIKSAKVYDRILTAEEINAFFA